jgi:hypothetical protein
MVLRGDFPPDLATSDDVEALGEDVHELALALVAPLRAQHSAHLLQPTEGVLLAAPLAVRLDDLPLYGLGLAAHPPISNRCAMSSPTAHPQHGLPAEGGGSNAGELARRRGLGLVRRCNEALGGHGCSCGHSHGPWRKHRAGERATGAAASERAENRLPGNRTVPTRATVS